MKICVQKADCRVIFDGLRVRMGGHTDVVTHHRFDHDKNQHHYSGELFDTTRAVAESGSGGQIVFSQATLRAVQSLTHVSSSKYGDVVLMHEGRHYLTSPSLPERDLSNHFRRLLCDQAGLEESTLMCNTSTLCLAQHSGAGGAPARDLAGSAGVTAPVNASVSAETSEPLSGMSAPIGEGVGIANSGVSMSGSVSDSSFHTQAAEVLHAALRFSPTHASHARAMSALPAHAPLDGSHHYRHSFNHKPRSFQTVQSNAADSQPKQAPAGSMTLHGRHAPLAVCAAQSISLG